MSRQPRGPARKSLEADLVEQIRGWQVDQDLFDEAAAAYAGLNRTDMRCLDVLERSGPMTAGQLAAAVRLTSGAVTAVLDRLEGAGLVRRLRDDADRRRVLVEATPRVMELMAPVYGPLAEDGYREMAGRSEEELRAAIDFLRRNREALARHTARVHDLIAARSTDRT